jgi:hypothetical protein
MRYAAAFVSPAIERDLMARIAELPLHPSGLANMKASGWWPHSAFATITPIIPIAVAAALDVPFARRIIVGIFDNDAAAALGAITAPALLAD